MKEKESRILHDKGPTVSMFENVWSREPIGKAKLGTWLLSDKYKEVVETYRAAFSFEQHKLKQNMPCITPCGEFSYGNEESLIQHSGMVCVDIDWGNCIRMQKSIDWEKTTHLMGKCFPSIYYAGLSVGGNGMFLIFRIQYPEHHDEQYAAIADEIKKLTDLEVDFACKNVVSMRVASYDPNPYFNPSPKPYMKMLQNVRTTPLRWGHESETIRKEVEHLIGKIVSSRTDITKQYSVWFKIGCAFASEFGEEGRKYFHQVSQFYPRYDSSECDLEYFKCLNYVDKVTIKSFYYYCGQHGIW